jgi:hypothetical protein
LLDSYSPQRNCDIANFYFSLQDEIFFYIIGRESLNVCKRKLPALVVECIDLIIDVRDVFLCRKRK